MDELVELGIGVHLIGGLPGDPGIGRSAVLQGKTHPIVIYTRAVVDQLVVGLLVVPGLDGIHTDLELEPRRYAIRGLIGGCLVAVGMGVQIDEPGRGHESLRLYRLFTRERLGRDRGDLVSDDPDVPMASALSQDRSRGRERLRCRTRGWRRARRTIPAIQLRSRPQARKASWHAQPMRSWDIFAIERNSRHEEAQCLAVDDGVEACALRAVLRLTDTEQP